MVLGKLRGEPKAIVARCNAAGQRDPSLEAVIVNTKEAEQLGYVELRTR